ncbi:MAG: hypothetical protein HQL54_13155 [Magnetococcales bacterium]|nr:hypothetical protein [Magnetococcales bacterium]
MDLVLLLFIGGSLAGIALGVYGVVRPRVQTEVLTQGVKDVLPFLFKPLRLERWVYRHNRWFGWFIFLGSLISLFVLWLWVGSWLLHPMRMEGENVLALVIYQTLFLFFLSGILFALLISVFIIVRPSLLKPFEAWANTPLTRERIQRALRRIRSSWLGRVVQYPRLSAGVVALVSAISLVLLIRLWYSING